MCVNPAAHCYRFGTFLLDAMAAVSSQVAAICLLHHVAGFMALRFNDGSSTTVAGENGDTAEELHCSFIRILLLLSVGNHCDFLLLYFQNQSVSGQKAQDKFFQALWADSRWSDQGT